MGLDYSLKTTEERVAYVKELLKNIPDANLTPKYKQYLADYILRITEKHQTKEEKNSEYQILTRNREATINKRQVSYEQVVSNLENGEDGIYALINNDKNQILDPKDPISDDDIEEIPALKEHMEMIEKLKVSFAEATGQRKYALKRQIIETWQQIYILKASAKGGPAKGKTSNQIKTMAKMDIPEEIYLDYNDMPRTNSSLSLIVPEHISFLLCYYTQLKQESMEDLNSDMHWMLIDLENLVEKTFIDYPVLYDLVVWKIDGLTNEEIQEKMLIEHGVVHKEQYYSTLWRKRIPKMVAEQAQKDFLIWYFTNVEYGEWKYCRTCGEYKPAHPMFFTRNTSKDNWYSVCKDCRRKKNK